MGMAEDIAHIRFQIERMATSDDMSDQLHNIEHKLKYDIEPKLDKALSGASTADPCRPSTDRMLWLVRQIAVEIRGEAKIEAIKWLRELTDCSLQEAKHTIEWLQSYSPYKPLKEAE